MKTPDNFEALNKLFKASEEDTPVDFAEFLEEPILKMVFKLGNAIERLAKWDKLYESGEHAKKVLDPIYEDIFKTCQKYMAVLRSRKEEFVECIQRIDTGDMPEYLIMENMTAVCLAVTRSSHDDDADDDDFDPYADVPQEVEPVFYCKKCKYIKYTHQITESNKCKICGEEVVPGDDDFDYEKDGPKS